MGHLRESMLRRLVLRGRCAAAAYGPPLVRCRLLTALASSHQTSPQSLQSESSSLPAPEPQSQLSTDRLVAAYSHLLSTDPLMTDDPTQRQCIEQLSTVMQDLVRHQAALTAWQAALSDWQLKRDTLVAQKKKERQERSKLQAEDEDKKKGFLSSLLSRSARKRSRHQGEEEAADRELVQQVERQIGQAPPCPAAPCGLYIFGDVGTGKSLLMDLFLAVTSHTAPTLMHRRLHFHEFTNEVHALLHSVGKESNEHDCNKLIPKVADKLLKLPQTTNGGGNAALLCFDEFQCSDVFTASILQSLLGYLMKRGVTMVATSNRAPQELNKDLLSGFQKDEFEKFLTELSRNCLPHHVESAVDYRKVHSIISGKPSKYWHPVTASNSKCLESAFTLAVEAIGGIEPAGREIQIGFGRRWHVDRCTRVGVPHDSGSSAHDSPTTAASVAFFDFKQLCDVPRGVPDYAALGREFDAVFIEGVPQLSLARRDEARRFILLIDELYNHGAVAWCTAQVPMDELFDGYKDGGFAVDLEIT